MQNSFAEDMRVLLPLSYISQYGYCPRRCGLLLLAQLWAENAYTAAGRVAHKRVHTQRVERRGDTCLLYELPVFSHQLGLSGFCDCVELRQDATGAPLPFGPGRFRMYPVEYKHGIVREEREYQQQLCAQAMCLEEQYNVQIPIGALFFIDAHRRSEVQLTKELRAATVLSAKALVELSQQAKLPAATYGPKCKKCSMLHACQPQLQRSSAAYYQKLQAYAENGDHTV